VQIEKAFVRWKRGEKSDLICVRRGV
jgi:hypothetical protein